MVNYSMLLIILLVLVYGAYKKVDMYESFIVGAKEALSLFTTLYPTLLSLLVLISLLQTSGFFGWIANLLGIIFKHYQLPMELIGMSILRPISGSGSLAFLTQIYEIYGTEEFIAKAATLIQGATDTTFYVITLYFSSVHMKKYGYSMALCLFLDVISISLAIFFALNFF